MQSFIVGSVCTTTSAISGPLPPDELLDPARVGVRGRERAGAEPQRQVGDEPLVGVDEAQLRGIDAELGAHDAAHGRGVAGDLVARGFLAERLEMRLHRRHLRHRQLDRPLDLLGDRVRLLEREVAGKLEVERELGAAVDRDDRDVVHLAHARHVERRSVRALAHGGVCLRRLDVDDDVRLRQRRLHRALDRVGRRVALADGRVVRDADHDVREHAPGRLTHAQAPQLHRGAEPDDRLACRLLRVRGSAVHQHVDVAPHQPRGGDQHEHRDEERRDSVGARMPGADEQQADEDGDRAGEVAPEVERVRRERGARVRARRAPRGDRPGDVDADHDADDEQRVPGRVHGRAAVDEPHDRAPDDGRRWQ